LLRASGTFAVVPVVVTLGLIGGGIRAVVRGDAFLNVALGVVAFLAGIFMIGVIAAYLSRPVERL
jgi:hypothetical protein